MKNKKESGFSYIDVMVAIVILLVGILALVSALTGAIVTSSAQENQLTARQLATSTMEAIISTKETNPTRLGWSSVGNIGSNPDANGVFKGKFKTGVNPILSDPGADQVVGTNDDTGAALDGFTREIIIRDECDTARPSSNCPTPGTYAVRIRSVRINIFYDLGRVRSRETLVTVLTDYAVKN